MGQDRGDADRVVQDAVVEDGWVEDTRVEDAVAENGWEVAPGPVDAPLARTLRYEALRRRPSQARITQVQRDAAAGRYGRRWQQAVDRASPAPLTMALFVGGLFAGVVFIAVIVMAFQGDMESVLIGLLVTAFFFVVPGAIAYAGAAAVRRGRWRRHAQAATFAEENGLELLLVASADELPPLVRERGRARTVVHGDLIIGSVRGQMLLAGTRTREIPSGDTSETRHLVWAALRLDPTRPARLPSQASVEKRLRERARRGDVRVRHDDWFTVGIEDRAGGLATIEALFETLDLALRD